MIFFNAKKKSKAQRRKEKRKRKVLKDLNLNKVVRKLLVKNLPQSPQRKISLCVLCGLCGSYIFYSNLQRELLTLTQGKLLIIVTNLLPNVFGTQCAFLFFIMHGVTCDFFHFDFFTECQMHRCSPCVTLFT